MLVKSISNTPRLIKCSITDHFTFRTPVPIAFFYRERIEEAVIVEALQRALVDFPIFAGELIRKNGQLYIDCNNNGVEVNVGNSEPFVDMIKSKALGVVLKIKIPYTQETSKSGI